MGKRIWLLLIVIALPASVIGEEAASPLVRQAQREYATAIAQADTDRTEAVRSAGAAYVAKLDAAIKQAMMAGDLSGANAINALKEEAKSAASTTAASIQAGVWNRLGGTRWSDGDGWICLHLDGSFGKSGVENAGGWAPVGSRMIFIHGADSKYGYLWLFDEAFRSATAKSYRLENPNWAQFRAVP